MENSCRFISNSTNINMNTKITGEIFSKRTTNCLVGNGINTIGQLLEKNKDDLLAIKHFGLTCLNEVKKVIINIDSLFVDEHPNNGSVISLEGNNNHYRKNVNINMDTMITEEIFSIRTTNCLLGKGIKTISQLLEKNEDDLLAIKHFGATCLNEVKKIIKDNIDGLSEIEYTKFTSKGTIISRSLLLGSSVRLGTCMCYLLSPILSFPQVFSGNPC